jgi:hypothetical protein
LVSTNRKHPHSTIRVLRESRRNLDAYMKGSVRREQTGLQERINNMEEFISQKQGPQEDQILGKSLLLW